MSDESIPAGNRAAAPDLPEIDEELLGRVLRHLESNVHRHGWDSRLARLHVYVLYDNRITETDQRFRYSMAANPRLGPGYRLGPLTAQMMFSPEIISQAPGHSFEALRRMAINLAGADAPAAETMRGVVKQPGLWALAACSEVWRRQVHGREQLVEEQSKSWADLPGSVEARNVICVDARDAVHVVTRSRGCKPELRMDAEHWRGDVSTSLRILMDMIYSRLPASADEADRRYPTILEYHDRLAAQA